MRKRLAVAAAAATGALAVAQPVTYTIDPTHTFVVFEADQRAISTLRGRFDRTEGSVVLDRAAGTGRIDIRVEAASLGTGIAALDARLAGPDFLDAGARPQLVFVADRLAFDGERLVSVAGALTMRGRTAPLTLEAVRFGCYAHPLLRREVCGGDFDATLKRSDWGMDPGVYAALPDLIRLRVQVEAIRQ